MLNKFLLLKRVFVDVITKYSLSTWQYALVIVLYIGYLCLVMFGGLRKKKIKAVKYLIMSLLMVYGVIDLFDGFSGTASIINFALMTAIALFKGVFMGKRKIVECGDGKYTIRHDKTYIIWWVIFFVLKMIFTKVVKGIFIGEVAIWQTVYYLTLYYIVRTITVFVVNPEIRMKNRSNKRS